jgi:hypothetical protein
MSKKDHSEYNHSTARFCAVAYEPTGAPQKSLTLQNVVLIFLTFGSGSGADVRLNPEWSTIVAPDDHAYFREILSDLGERAEFDPESLMDQLSNLNVGPLVTWEAGTRLSSHPDLLRMYEQFRPPNSRD